VIEDRGRRTHFVRRVTGCANTLACATPSSPHVLGVCEDQPTCDRSTRFSHTSTSQSRKTDLEISRPCLQSQISIVCCSRTLGTALSATSGRSFPRKLTLGDRSQGRSAKGCNAAPVRGELLNHAVDKGSRTVLHGTEVVVPSARRTQVIVHEGDEPGLIAHHLVSYVLNEFLGQTY
jgi:hypothetical protein